MPSAGSGVGRWLLPTRYGEGVGSVSLAGTFGWGDRPGEHVTGTVHGAEAGARESGPRGPARGNAPGVVVPLEKLALRVALVGIAAVRKCCRV
jgi:hypothetical protein